jgi:hypothetical protein
MARAFAPASAPKLRIIPFEDRTRSASGKTKGGYLLGMALQLFDRVTASDRKGSSNRERTPMAEPDHLAELEMADRHIREGQGP